jgi:hypothetical protein
MQTRSSQAVSQLTHPTSLHQGAAKRATSYFNQTGPTLPDAALDRLRKCLPETDQRRIDAEMRLGSTPDKASDSAARQPRWNGHIDARRVLYGVRNHRANHAEPAGTLAQQRAALRDAMRVGYPGSTDQVIELGG